MRRNKTRKKEKEQLIQKEPQFSKYHEMRETNDVHRKRDTQKQLSRLSATHIDQFDKTV